MALLSAIRLPVEWDEFGFPNPVDLEGTVLATGEVAWSWDGDCPDLPIGRFTPTPAEPGPDGWRIDHVVVMVQDLRNSVEVFSDVGLRPRLRTRVRDREMAFFRAGAVIEVIESPVRLAALYGLALVTDEPLEVLALRWRGLGHEVTDPTAAIQPGRRILTVRGLGTGLAVMSPERAL